MLSDSRTKQAVYMHTQLETRRRIETQVYVQRTKPRLFAYNNDFNFHHFSGLHIKTKFQVLKFGSIAGQYAP